MMCARNSCILSFLLILANLSVLPFARADIHLPQLFSDHMVIQRYENVPVWGWAERGEKIVVSFRNQTKSTQADRQGKWMVSLDPTPAGGPYEMQIRGKQETIILKDILVGEVWVCSGQSNMEWVVSNSQDADAEIAAANYPQIRHFKVPHLVSSQPQSTLEGEIDWQVCQPATVGNFTAVGYFFARELHQRLGVPIGLINSSWGGTEVEAWISPDVLADFPEFSNELVSLNDMSLEEMLASRQEELKAQFGGTLETEVPFIDETPTWALPVVPLEGWKPISVPGLWESKGLPQELDGTIWFRKSFSVTEDWLAGEAALSLGPIDDADETWINGVKVGSSGSYNIPRNYIVPEGTLKKGKNTLVVKVVDTGGGGGIYGNPEDIFLQKGAHQISLAGEWLYRPSQILVRNTVSPNDYGTLLYNAMIQPLIPYRIKGAIWYQGESNASRAYQYRRLFPAMIQNWREKWGQGPFPFLFVQLANFRQAEPNPGESTWAELREAQTMALDLPNTGMASAIDVGEANDIHPRDKQTVGYRLALHAMKDTYGEKTLQADGPLFDRMERSEDAIVITFKAIGEGLMAKDKYGYVRGFSIAGRDREFVWARAEIIGKNRVKVYHPAIKDPVAVRYGWADNPADINLYNKAGLPANPFRTDDWPGITQAR